MKLSDGDIWLLNVIRSEMAKDATPEQLAETIRDGYRELEHKLKEFKEALAKQWSNEAPAQVIVDLTEQLAIAKNQIDYYRAKEKHGGCG